ncbi:hypothetical protein RUND412_007451 [Rhizina undulata]
MNVNLNRDTGFIRPGPYTEHATKRPKIEPNGDYGFRHQGGGSGHQGTGGRTLALASVAAPLMERSGNLRFGDAEVDEVQFLGGGSDRKEGTVNGNGKRSAEAISTSAPSYPMTTTATTATVPRQTQKPFIDLTLSDDDEPEHEVSVLQESKVRPQTRIVELCFGMINNASVSAHMVPAPAPASDKFPASWPLIPVKLLRGNPDSLVICAIDHSGKEFGCVDINTARALAPLMDKKLVRTQARLMAREKRGGEKVGDQVSQHLKMFINIYGTKNVIATVGTMLSQKNVFLQRPLYSDGLEYKNPHYGENNARTWSRSSGRSNGSGPSYVSRTAEEAKADVNGVFDSLLRSDKLPEMDPPAGIKTPLLSHQKQGLYFLKSKERERTFSEDEAGNSSLWRLRKRSGGGVSYYNVITGEESRDRPAEVLGGILADMMGLGKTLQIISLIVSTFEEAETFSTAASMNAKTTLLISPLSTIGNWEEQIAAHTRKDTLKVYVYHGNKRETDLMKLKEYDLIITTYQVVAMEYSKGLKTRGDCPLQRMCWFRIVLDEAHMIREQSTLQSKAVLALNAQRRWAVTGTPVQNRLEDLAALIKFLRLKPFDDKTSFNQYISIPLKSADPDCIPRLRLLVDSVTLRRLKDRIDLPPRKDKIVYLEFSSFEREIYDATARQSSARMDLVAKTGQVGGKAYVHILQSILRLRLICAHGRELLGEDDIAGMTTKDAINIDELEEKGPALSRKQAWEIFGLMREAGEDVCAVCRKKAANSSPDAAPGSRPPLASLTPCAHLLCKDCVVLWKEAISKEFTDGMQASCPICGIFIRADLFELREEDEYVDHGERKGKKKEVRYRGPSTKVTALLESLLENRTLGSKEDPIKSVVFSCWTSHMDLIEIAFKNASITHVRLDGRLSRAARDKAIATFREDPSIEVILVSLMAGGLGLNLTAASRVYVMEPQFNPAAEAQAIDRIHRLGQKKVVETVRFIMMESFEERIMEMQSRKTRLATVSLGRGGGMDRGEVARMRLEDLKALFR